MKINEKAKKIEKNALMLYLINSLMKCASETQEVNISYGLQQFLH